MSNPILVRKDHLKWPQFMKGKDGAPFSSAEITKIVPPRVFFAHVCTGKTWELYFSILTKDGTSLPNPNDYLLNY